MDRHKFAERIRTHQAENTGPYTDEQWERALVASQRSDALSITIRAITLVVVYALLARAVLNGLTGPTLLLPLVVELIAMLLVGWLVLRPLIDCRKFRRSMGGIMRSLIFFALLLAAAYGLLESPASLRDDTALLLAIASAVAGLLVSSLNEALHWRSQRGVFVWTSINFMSFRIGVLLVLGFIGAFILLPAYFLEVLPDRDSPLVESLAVQQWAWLVWTILLLLDIGALTVQTMMHREAREKHTQPAAE